MSSRFPGLGGIRLKGLALFLLALAVPAASAQAADEPDLIFRRSTVFKLMSPNDKLATYGLDDPEVEGVACHFTVPEKGGFKGWLGLAEEVSDISLACRQVGPIKFKTKMEQGDDMFRQRRSLFFKKMQIVRGCDTKRNVLVYMKEHAIAAGDQPYGAVVVQAGAIIGWGPSRVRELGELAGHAEREAIRDAQRRTRREDLSGCAMYSTSRPCGACQRAAAQAKIARMYYGPQAADAGAP